MIQRTKHGAKPKELLEEIKAQNPQFSTCDLADAFTKSIGVHSLDIIQPIWYWKRYRKTGGHSDDELDALIIAEIKKRGVV